MIFHALPPCVPYLSACPISRGQGHVPVLNQIQFNSGCIGPPNVKTHNSDQGTTFLRVTPPKWGMDVTCSPTPPCTFCLQSYLLRRHDWTPKRLRRTRRLGVGDRRPRRREGERRLCGIPRRQGDEGKRRRTWKLLIPLRSYMLIDHMIYGVTLFAQIYF